MRAAIYQRVSTDKQSDVMDGKNSFPIQYKTCLNYCESKGYTVVKTYKDCYSGRNMDVLPEFKRMMRDTGNIDGFRKQFDIIVFYDITRFSRNTSQGLNYLDRLMKKNIRVYSVMDECGYDRFTEKNVFRLILSRSENESDMIQFRVNESIRFRKNRGDKLGNPPYGMEAFRNIHNIRDFRTNSSESQIVDRIQELKYHNVNSQSIAIILNDSGCKKRKREWTKNSVQSVIKRYPPHLNVHAIKKSITEIIDTLQSDDTKHNSIPKTTVRSSKRVKK